MKPFSKLVGLSRFALKRQWHHPGLTLLALLGVILTVGLVTSASFFAGAVDKVILLDQLEEFSCEKGRPAFSFRVYTFPSSRRPMSVEEAEEAASHIAETLSSEIGLPTEHLGLEVSANMMLQPPEGSDLYEENQYLESVKLLYKTGIEDQVERVEGDPLEDGTSEEILDVWMHHRLADEIGAQIGEEFSVGVNLRAEPIPIRLRGFWKVRDPEAPFWFKKPGAGLRNALLVRQQDFVTHVQPRISSKTDSVSWHIILDQDQLVPDDTREYIAGVEEGLAIVNKYLPDARLDTPPLDPLRNFVQRETTLTTLLLGFNVPAFGFLLYFLILTSAIIVRWQRRETAVLVSRGMGMSGVLGTTLIEELTLFVVGYPLGVGFGMLLARVMGYTSSFLTFSIDRTALPVSLRSINVHLTLVALGVSLIARLLPAARAARHSVVEAEREHARPLQSPFWYRYYFDLLLALPVFYAYRQLANTGTLALLVRDRPEDLYQDPLLILVPALFILAVALVTMRVFPLIMRLIDRLASIIPQVTPHLALRQLSRRSQGYMNPLLLIIISLALGVYTLSMATSFDQWVNDRMYYRVGADLTFYPQPKEAEGGGGMPGEDADSSPIGGGWIPLPGELAQLPGVAAATRVGAFPMEADLAGGDEVHGRFLGVDRLTFPTVAWFRDDFANESLGALMNRLALHPGSILISHQMLEESHVRIGDEVSLRIRVEDLGTVTSPFTVVGTYDLFPTVYEEDEITFIGNLEHLGSFLGITPPHRVWLDLESDVEGEGVLDAFEEAHRGLIATSEKDAQALIAEEQAKTEWSGVFGTLSVGFLAAVAMAAAGLMIYSYASLRERVYRFSVLHAVGLLPWQIVSQVILEYVFLITYGVAVGTGIGTVASKLFVPFFKVTGEEGVPLPPIIPLMARHEVVILVAVFTCAMVILEALVIARALPRRRLGMLKHHAGY